MSTSNEQTTLQKTQFVQRLLGAAGGAILAGALGVWIFDLLKEAVPSVVISMIAGMAGGGVAIAHRRLAKRKDRGEKE
ncbi:MAG: hypothetical protein FWD77_10335 [Betaproteobacteria bacterium]|nr:hypothetical protein [Betaproteobacteria bacterium]